MIYNLQRISKKILIAGISGSKPSDVKATIEKLRSLEIPFQLIRVDRVAGVNHLFSAAEHALVAQERGARISHSVEMDILLYAAGERQIKEAIRKLGVEQTTSAIAVVAVVDDEASGNKLLERAIALFNGRIDDGILEDIDTKRVTNLEQAFHISEEAIDACRQPGETKAHVVQKLVLESIGVFAATI